MRWIGARLSVAVLLAGLAGCQTIGPMMREPNVLIPAGAVVECDQNPFFVPPVPYGKLFETLRHVLIEYDFEIADSHRADGRIESVPRVSPGVLPLFRPGSPDLYDRLLATFQTYRHRVTVIVQPSEDHSYFVEVIVRKELEDLIRPVRSSIGGAIFRMENDVERQFEVIDPTFYDSTWIFKGRDV